MSKTKRLVVSLPIDLHQYIVDTARGNQSFVVKEAIDFYRCGQSIFPIGNLDELKEAAEALKEMRREYGSDWKNKLIEQRRDDNYFDEEYS